MSTLVRGRNGQRFVVSDRSRMAQGLPRNALTHQLNGLGWWVVVAKALPAIYSAVQSAIGGKGPNKDENIWNGYASIFGKFQGRDYDAGHFDQILNAFWALHKKRIKHEREPLMGIIAQHIDNAIRTGVLPPTAGAQEFFNKVISVKIPETAPFPGPFVDVIDRYLNNLYIGGGAPLILDSLKDWIPAHTPVNATPTPALPAPSAPVSPVVTPTPTNVSPISQTPLAPAPYPGSLALSPQSSVNQLQPLLDALTAQGANQQQMFNAALQSLSSRGVAVTPQVQAQVAEQVQAKTGGSLPSWAIPAGIGGLALLFLMMRRRR